MSCTHFNTFYLSIFMVLNLNLIHLSEASLCSNAARKGPFEFQEETAKIITPARTTFTAQRIRVTQDVELAVLYRSYWKSYCYNGGALDGNTGCFNGVTQAVPSYEESKKWIEAGKCAVGPDCADCWGNDAKACLEIDAAAKHMINGKELTKTVNNNHFAFHTCNISWRCGLNKAKFPTFVTRRNDKWVAYTEYANGTELILDTRDYWVHEDYSLRKVSDHIAIEDQRELACFVQEQKEVGCYDQELGNFVEFRKNWACQGRACYLLDANFNFSLSNENAKYAELKAASMEDLKGVIATEHQLNEELRYNFGLVLEELITLRKTLTKTILSLAKVDDRLIGNILGQPTRSQFLSDSTFFLSPCTDPEKQESNCFGDLIFKNGRWSKKTKKEECVNVQQPKKIAIFGKNVEMWFPEIRDKELVGTSSEMEGWSYYAQQKQNLHEAMLWVKDGQSTTSLGDVYGWPKGFVNHALIGFLSGHIFLFSMVGILTIAFWRILKKSNTRTIPSVTNQIQVNERNCLSRETVLYIPSMDPETATSAVMNREMHLELPNGIIEEPPKDRCKDIFYYG